MKKIPMFEHNNLPENEPVKGFWMCVRAYEAAREFKAACPIFTDVIWEDQIHSIVNIMREEGVKKILLTYGGSGWIDRLAAFQENGCKLGKVVQITMGTDYKFGENVPRIVNGMTIKL